MEHWFRVVTGPDGSIVSVTLVDSAGEENGGVFYVRAESKTAAATAGKAAFNEYCRNKLREQRATYRSQGRCQCGRAIDTDGVRCSECRNQVARSRERKARRDRGEAVPTANECREQTKQRRRVSETEQLEAAARLKALDDVRAAWATATDTNEFARWLRDEIHKLRQSVRATRKAA